jgi:hypothetical protein
MSVSHELAGQHVSFVLPVTLSASARRSVLLSTGVEPTAEQIFVVNNLTDLPAELRARMVDTWEKINVHVDEEERYIPDDDAPYLHMNGARNDGYLSLQRNATERWTRYLPGTDGDRIGADDVFYATPDRTVGAIEYLRATLAPGQDEALDAMLAGAPLVDGLGEADGLRVEDVLDAYERALEIAQQLVDLVDSGTRAEGMAWFGESFTVTNDAIFLYPDLGNDPPNRPAAILKQSDPQAYTRARELLDQLKPLPTGIVTEKIDRTCHHWWSANYTDATDQSKVDDLLRMDLVNALNDVKVENSKREATERYEQCRASWIARHGSQRLKRAAARDYRHDGIYRDERLKLELPDFVGSLGRKPTIRELVNPSERALELESQVLARAEALGIPDDKVRLVFAQPGQDSDWADGEFVQIEDYLGRHTIWQSVSGVHSGDDDIPF